MLMQDHQGPVWQKYLTGQRQRALGRRMPSVTANPHPGVRAGILAGDIFITCRKEVGFLLLASHCKASVVGPDSPRMKAGLEPGVTPHPVLRPAKKGLNL